LANIIERAYELARGGSCRSVQEIEAKLKAEKFESVLSHLNSPSLRRDLRQIMLEAQRARVSAE
jgi:hypothetical protein